VISKAFAPHCFDKIHVQKCIRVINFNCGAKSKYKHEDCLHLIKVSSFITKIVKILLFLVQFIFMHRPSIIMFVACRVWHDVMCIVVMVVQVHASVNQK